jgi:hypothetical protein
MAIIVPWNWQETGHWPQVNGAQLLRQTQRQDGQCLSLFAAVRIAMLVHKAAIQPIARAPFDQCTGVWGASAVLLPGNAVLYCRATGLRPAVCVLHECNAS